MKQPELFLAEILTSLRVANQLPPKIDLSKVGNRFWCVIDDDKSSDTDNSKSIISEKVFTGMSFSKETAVLKALSERAERQAFIDGAKSGLASCLTPRSDGFAALPRVLQPEMNIRDFALNEAIERFVWANWWDSTNVAHDLSEWTEVQISKENLSYVRETLKGLDIESLQLVLPKVKDDLNKQVIILIGRLNGQGFISGGACGNKSELESIFFRAFDELYRHGSAFKRSKEFNIKPTSFYERRLIFFASGLGDQLVKTRLGKSGTSEICLPELTIDQNVPTNFLDFTVHRCYFDNQPPFMGGAIERFCL
jgi:hypothetical protein